MSAEGEGPIPHRRRSSIVEMFSGRGSANTSAFSTSPPAGVPANPNVSHRKSMSMALGLAGSVDNQNSPYNAFARQRRASISTSNGSPEFRNSFDDNAAIVEEEDRVGSMNTPPSPSFARRLSFGAQAMKDVRGGISPSNAVGRRPSSALYALSEDGNSTQAHAKSRSSRTAKTGGKSRGRSSCTFFMPLMTTDLCALPHLYNHIGVATYANSLKAKDSIGATPC